MIFRSQLVVVNSAWNYLLLCWLRLSIMVATYFLQPTGLSCMRLGNETRCMRWVIHHSEQFSPISYSFLFTPSYAIASLLYLRTFQQSKT